MTYERKKPSTSNIVTVNQGIRDLVIYVSSHVNSKTGVTPKEKRKKKKTTEKEKLYRHDHTAQHSEIKRKSMITPLSKTPISPTTCA